MHICYNRIQNKELSLEVLDSKYLNDIKDIKSIEE